MAVMVVMAIEGIFIWFRHKLQHILCVSVNQLRCQSLVNIPSNLYSYQVLSIYWFLGSPNSSVQRLQCCAKRREARDFTPPMPSMPFMPSMCWALTETHWVRTSEPTRLMQYQTSGNFDIDMNCEYMSGITNNKIELRFTRIRGTPESLESLESVESLETHRLSLLYTSVDKSLFH